MIKLKNYWNKTKKFLTVHENISASLFFVVLILIFFSPVVFNGKTLTTSVVGGGVMPLGAYGYEGVRPPIFAVRDPGAFNWVDEPLSEYTGKVVKNDIRIPLWNSNMGFGYPILGGLQTGIFFPLNYIVFLFSSELAWDIFILLKIFLAGFFTYLFARRIGLDQKSGFLAGIIFMFNGYFVNYLNMAHFSIEVMIPLLLFSYETFLSKPNVKRLLLCILSIALLILPGMPEATFFAILIGSLWFLFSYFFLHRDDLKLTKLIIVFLLANISALLLTMVQLIPFWEMLNNSFNAHSGSSVGLDSLPLNTVLSVFYPFIFNPLYNWIGQFHYIGISSLILFFISILSLRYFKKKERNIIIFFVLFIFFGFAKVYGASFINWIGSLPILNVQIFAKYGSPAMIFSISIVSAYGFFLLSRKYVNYINAKIIIAFVFLTSFTIYGIDKTKLVFYQDFKKIDSFLVNIFKNYILEFDFKNHSRFIEFINPYLTSSVFIGLNLILGFTIFLVFYILIINTNNRKRFFCTTLLFFVFFELYFYSLPLIRADRYDTFKKPPYVQYLESNKNEVARIYGQTYPGQGVMLYPNVSSVFGIQDIRFIMALGVKRYFDFIKNIVEVPSDEVNGVRFTGSFPLALESRNFDLMNVKYFLTPPGFGQSDLLSKIDSSRIILSDKKEFVGKSSAVLEGKSIGGLMLHAPSKIMFPLLIDEKNKDLSFEYGIADTGVEGTDGVRFIVSFECGGKPKEVINDLVNPRNDKKYESWQRAKLDFSDCLGKEAKVTFGSQDNGNNAFDHFFVGNFFTESDKVVYDGEVTITKNEDYVPKVFVVHKAEELFDQDKIFAKLKNPDFDMRKEIIIEKDLPDGQLSGNGVPADDNSKATITDYKDEKVKIDVSMENEGFLVLLDQYYPGWKALVDGKEVEIYPTDYVFRSIYLEKGNHKVEFIYDPLSYKVGKWISIATILLLITAYIFREKIDRRFFKQES